MPGTISRGELLKDRYRLERMLGRGGMAAVWLGLDLVLDRPVAVKVLSDTIASDPNFVIRFRREARTAAALSHPNLVRVYDFSDQGERPYLVMEFVPGENLATRLERGEHVECDQLAGELLGALSHIHEVGILHRDIKPGNIVIEPDGTAKLIDFGIALPPDATALTSTGLILGTERFAPPEILAGRPATERSDLYSCGLVLRLCARRSSPALRALIGAMTSKDPRDRPLSAEDALGRLERPGVAVEQPTEVFAPSFTRHTERLPRTEDRVPPPLPPGSGTHRRRVVAAALGLLVAFLVVGLIILSGGDDSRRGGDRDTAGTNAASREAATAGGGAPPRQSVSSEEAGSAQSSPSPGRSETDLEDGASLNEQGFAMIQAGEYEAAVPVLEEAVDSFPGGTEDLNYAYALFNLGNAFRLSGRPEEAIPILERRLEIPNQQGDVREELEAARAEVREPASFSGD